VQLPLKMAANPPLLGVFVPEPKVTMVNSLLADSVNAPPLVAMRNAVIVVMKLRYN
jgi:hypothetical protein